MWTIFKSLYWIWYNIASGLCFGFLASRHEILALRPGIEPAPPALEGEVLTTGLPGKSLVNSSEAEGTRQRFLGRAALGLGFDVRIGIYFCVSLVAQMVKNLLAMQETQGWSPGREGPLEKEMATYSSILVWRIPWTEVPGRLQSTGLQRDGHSWVTNTNTFTGLYWSWEKDISERKERKVQGMEV